MKIRKITYILMIALLLLTACGKEETKENAEKTGVEKETDKNPIDETKEKEVEVSSADIENTKDEEQTEPVQTPNDDDNKNSESKSNSTTTEHRSNTQTSTEKPSTGNTTTQKPSNDSNNQTTQKEEVKDHATTDSQLKAEADAAASKYMNYYQEVLRLVNEIRAEVGVAPLTLNTTMCQAASMRAIEMDYKAELSHTRPNGSSCFTALDFYGVSYSSAGENIAMGYSSPASVVNGWRNSEGHYKNMISPDYTQLGVGYSNMQLYGNNPYWVQLFAK